MSIKPVDFNVMLPKTQEVSISKHIENMKNQNIVDSQFVEKEKNLKRDIKRVKNTEKTEHSKIDTSKKNKDGNKNKQNHSSKDKNKKEDKTNKDKMGSKIDIRI